MGQHARRSPQRAATPQRAVAITVAALVIGACVGAYAIIAGHRVANHSDSDRSPVALTSRAAASSSAQASTRARGAVAQSASAAKESAQALASSSAAASAAAAAQHAATVAAAQAAVTGLTGSVGASGYSISATNLTTGATFSAGAAGGMVTASVVKLDILETMLLQHQRSGQPLSDYETTEATAMIENSDNDAAEDLWEDVGSDTGVAAANTTLGPANTQPGTDDYWGLTTTYAGDQAILLKNLVTSGPLTAASQAFALNLMQNVESDQRWGVGVIADAGSTFANKNGWLAVSDDNNLWTVNSDGVVTVHGQQVVISIMTQHDLDFQTGVNLVQSLATAVVPALVA